RRLHLLEAALIALENLGLIRNCDLCIDYEWEVEGNQFAQNSRKGGVGKILKADERIEYAADVQMKFSFVQNADIGHLLAGAAVFNPVFSRNIAASIWFKGIESTLGLEEQFLIVETARAQLCRLHRSFDPYQQALKLG